MTIGERLTKIRKDNGLSQEAFGFELGVSRQAISKWESDSAIPDVDKLIAISKKYGVSVGWILGTEEETGPVSPDLSGDQTKMVKEIIDKYIAALNERQQREELFSDNQESVVPEKPSPLKKVAAWAAVIVTAGLLVWCGSLNQKLANMEQNYYSIQNDIRYMQTNMTSQINSISGKFKEVLESQNMLFSVVNTEVTGADLNAGTVDIKVTAIPKTYERDLDIYFIAESGGETVKAQAVEISDDHTFEATLTCAHTDTITISSQLDYGDRVDSQVCNIIYGEYSSSIPKIWGYGLGDIWAETLTDINKGYVHEHIDVEVENPRIDYYGNIVTTEKVEYRVYVNRELKNTYTAETLSEEESPSRGNESVWFRLNFDFTHQLKEGDEVIYAAYLTDNYGREQYAITDCYRITDGRAELHSAAWEELTDSKIVVG